MTATIEQSGGAAAAGLARPVRLAVLTGLMAVFGACGGGGLPPDAAVAAPGGNPGGTAPRSVPDPSAPAVDAALLLALSSADPLTRLHAVAGAVDADPSGSLAADVLLDHRLSVRLEAVDELARLPPAPAARLLRRALDDGEALVREAALYTLEEVDPKAARRAAERAVCDPDVMVREAAREVLLGLGPRR